MAKNNREDGKRSVWFDSKDHTVKTCGTCGGSGSKVDRHGQHAGACGTCRGFGQVNK